MRNRNNHFLRVDSYIQHVLIVAGMSEKLPTLLLARVERQGYQWTKIWTLRSNKGSRC